MLASVKHQKSALHVIQGMAILYPIMIMNNRFQCEEEGKETPSTSIRSLDEPPLQDMTFIPSFILILIGFH